MDHPSVSLSPHRSSYEDKQYSVGVDCPLIGMIYPVESCEKRLTSKDKYIKCSYGPACPRYVGEKPKKAEQHKQNHHEDNCVCCGVFGDIQGRGLIRVCYNRNHAKGTLAQFPPTGKRAKT
jgi:hypothetical protein